jgi:hypothetical protein
MVSRSADGIRVTNEEKAVGSADERGCLKKFGGKWGKG